MQRNQQRNQQKNEKAAELERKLAELNQKLAVTEKKLAAAEKKLAVTEKEGSNRERRQQQKKATAGCSSAPMNSQHQDDASKWEDLNHELHSLIGFREEDKFKASSEKKKKALELMENTIRKNFNHNNYKSTKTDLGCQRKFKKQLITTAMYPQDKTGKPVFNPS